MNKKLLKSKKGFIWHFLKHDQSGFKVESNKGAGFTLVELLLYMGIFSIFLAITLQMFGAVFDVQIESEAVTSVTSDGKYIIERFSYDVNRATSISSPDIFGSPSGSLTFISEGQNMTYSLDNGDLILTNNTSGTSDQLNSNEASVSDLEFIKLDGGGKDTVQVTFTLTSEAIKASGREVATFKTSAGLR